MGEMEPHRRTPARELFLGILLVFIVGAAIILAAWAMRLRARELALRSPAPPMRIPGSSSSSRASRCIFSSSESDMMVRNCRMGFMVSSLIHCPGAVGSFHAAEFNVQVATGRF